MKREAGALRELEYRIGAEFDGMRAGDYLRRHQGFSGRVLRDIRKDASSVDCCGSHIRLVDPLHTGDVLRIRLQDPDWQLEPSSLSVPIAYEDEDVIVFNKPAGMPCHPTPAHRRDTLANVFAGLCAQREERMVFRPLNRLDKDTSGLVLAAKNSYAASWAAQSCQKQYLALCCGRLPEDFGRIDLPIGQPDAQAPRRAVLREGQRAVTNYRVLQRFDNYTLLCISLETGRTHQIRVHFAHTGHPLAGDPLYGGTMELLDHQALHCFRLRFQPPGGQQAVWVQGALCKEFENALHLLGK